MKKIAIIAPDALPVPPVRGGGIENGIWEILPHFSKYETHVLSVYDPALDNLAEYEQVGAHHIHRFYQSPKQRAWLRLRYLSFNFHFPYAYVTARKLNEIQPDIIHIRSRLWLIPYYKKLLTFNPKIILHHHNHYFCKMPDWQVKSYLNRIDAFVGVSNYTTTTEVLNRFPQYEKKCFDIHNGITLSKFNVAPEHKDPVLMNKTGLKRDDIVLLFVGRVSPSKGVHIILRAIKPMLAQMPELKLLVVGSSWFGENKEDDYTQELKKLSEDIKDNVIFTGFINRSEIESYYHLADIFLVPSIFQDPSPNTCYEASAVGLPIIASDRGGIPEIVDDGNTGFILRNVEDPAELRDKLIYLLKDKALAKSLGQAARKRMEQTFTWKHAAVKTEKIYSYLLGETENL